jgi:hypothetical protein
MSGPITIRLITVAATPSPENEALASYDRAISRARLQQQGAGADAIGPSRGGRPPDRKLEIQPEHLDALNNRGKA